MKEMTMTDRKNVVRWDSGTNAVLGSWLVIAPFALMYGVASATWNDAIVGVLVATLAATWAFGAFGTTGPSWTNVALGAWLVAAPFLLGDSDLAAALRNDIIVGVAVLGLAWRSASIRPEGPAA